MLRIMLQKLWHKKWMNCCLLLGSILLIATVVSFPLYQTAIYDRMLQDEFRNYLMTKGGWPTLNSFLTVSDKEYQGTAISRMEEMTGSLGKDFGVTPRQTIFYYSLASREASSALNRADVQNVSMRLSALSDLPAHAQAIYGEMFSENGMTEDGCIEVVVSQAAFVEMNLLVGETIVFNGLKDAEGNEIRLYIKGVYEKADNDQTYWQLDPNEMTNICLMNYDLFHQMFTGDNAAFYKITCYYYFLFEYQDIKASQVEHLVRATDYLTNESIYRSTTTTPEYRELLDTYLRKQGRIQATLVILQIPVLIMLGAFLFMISGQMYEMERNEISVIKSRGSSGSQIFRLYLYQNTFLTLVGGALGIPLGSVFSRILGSARNFLEFDSSRTLNLTFTVEVWLYAAAAMGVTLLIMSLPAIKHSRVTIVKLKQQKAMRKKNWWEKIFLDVILLGLSVYGYYSFHKNSQDLALSVLMGEPLDPLLYISSSLFILGFGLLFLRLQPYIVQLIYILGKRFWKPASYASFMENIKNGRKQQFIMLFLIVTISLGMYHATVARTILQNARDNAEYLNSPDVALQEVWLKVTDRYGVWNGEYIEPDYTKYAGMEFADTYTRVEYDRSAYIDMGGNTRQNITVMGIHTKDFGAITWLEGELTKKHYYEYLNELALAENGILVSGNFRDKLGYAVGDAITYRNERGIQLKGTIVDFFDYWPGYQSTVADLNPDGTAYVEDNYLLVTHYDLLRQSWGVMPYEVWIGLKDGYDAGDVEKWLVENNVSLSKYVNREAAVRDTVQDPLLQGTNGVLTMGFLVTILLCAVGYLIYWIMSIRSREMIFGVLRACGMHKGELFHMLMNEQIFSGVFSVFAGIGIGKLASVMFVPMMQQAYAVADQAVPMKLVTNASDMMRLYVVIAAAMLICLAVLILLLFKLNVAKALKLGEE